jgi:hypothetical protein
MSVAGANRLFGAKNFQEAAQVLQRKLSALMRLLLRWQPMTWNMTTTALGTLTAPWLRLCRRPRAALALALYWRQWWLHSPLRPRLPLTLQRWRLLLRPRGAVGWRCWR